MKSLYPNDASPYKPTTSFVALLAERIGALAAYAILYKSGTINPLTSVFVLSKKFL